jgi:hypothetical protein
MATPAWLAATASEPTAAGQVNQFLGAHAATLIYTGTVQSSQVTAGSGAVNSDGLYIAQSFTTGAAQTTLGRVLLTFAKTGTPAPVSVSLQANSGGSPSGTPLVTTLLPADFLSGTPALFSIPLPASGLSPSTQYWIVLNAVGDASDYFSWSKSNQTSGAKTSTNDTSWTAQTYGLLYEVCDNTLLNPLVHTWEDTGARWTLMLYNTLLQLVTLAEYTAGQTATGYVVSARSLSYTAGQLASIA